MELKAIQTLSRAAKDEIRLMSHKRFSYGRIFELAEQANGKCILPHRTRAKELGMHIDDVPVSPALTRLTDAKRRIENVYADYDLEEEGIDVNAMLTYMTEQEVIEELEERGVEQAVTLNEAEALLVSEEFQAVLLIPYVKSEFFSLRQMEEITPGNYADISAFNTADYLRNAGDFEFDKYRYMTDKVAERAEDLAIMHSCITDEEGRSKVRQNFIAFVNCRYRNYALRLVAMHNATEDEIRKAELLGKIEKQNRQIRRLKQIWKKFAYTK